jgi:AcrR family transcriptional regulator
MPPRRSPERLLEIVDAATEVFAQTGFAAAQMVDVARMAGVSVGTLYNYVEGKGALLLLCAERPFTDITEGRDLPVPTPDRVELIARLDETLIRHVHVATLDRALRTPLQRAGLESQLGHIVGELFDLISVTRVAADAMERSARDAPDLGDLFYRRVRVRLLEQLLTYARRLRKVEAQPPHVTPDVAARFILETVTWWARHRHRDPAPPIVDDTTAREIADELVVATLTHQPTRR